MQPAASLSRCRTDSSDLVGCWSQKTPFAPSLIPTIFKDCHDAIKYKLMLDPKLAMVPQHFSRTLGRGFTVPQRWQSGNCVIEIDTHTIADEDTFRFLDIAVQASMISIHCVAKPPHFGGTSFVGAKQVLNVTIYGSPVLRLIELEDDKSGHSSSIAEE
ncbi:MAG: hypothetical protein Q9216_000532 [Gyalolechia sp. 2 TL-2023]